MVFSSHALALFIGGGITTICSNQFWTLNFRLRGGGIPKMSENFAKQFLAKQRTEPPVVVFELVEKPEIWAMKKWPPFFGGYIGDEIPP